MMVTTVQYRRTILQSEVRKLRDLYKCGCPYHFRQRGDADITILPPFDPRMMVAGAVRNVVGIGVAQAPRI